MKRIFTIIIAVLLTASVFAQAPEKMSYQAVIRDASDNLVTNQTVGMQISILQGSTSGTVVYSETQTPTTNDNGLLSIEFGGGIGFDTINWANDSYFIKTETDLTGGSTYTITGTSQLLSVPYALYSNNSLNDNTGNQLLSFSSDTIITGSFKNIDTVNVKANRVVTIKGYTQSTGSACAVYLFDLTNNQYLDNSTNIHIIYEENGVCSNLVGYNGVISRFSTDKVEFIATFIPLEDLTLIVKTKELSATAGNGVGEAAVLVIQ
jgi:hypothetical protein